MDKDGFKQNNDKWQGNYLNKLEDNLLQGSLQASRELLTEKGEFSTQAEIDADPQASTKRGFVSTSFLAAGRPPVWGTSAGVSAGNAKAADDRRAGRGSLGASAPNVRRAFPGGAGFSCHERGLWKGCTISLT